MTLKFGQKSKNAQIDWFYEVFACLKDLNKLLKA